MTSSPPVTLYTYNSSPFGKKLQLALAVKEIPYEIVQVPVVPPRPQLELLGLHYRRIPVLAIGRELFCDTSVIIDELERRFPDKPRLFPQSLPGMTQAASALWIDRNLFGVISSLLPSEVFESNAFHNDREQYFGGKIDPKALAAAAPKFQSNVRPHFALLEKQLSASGPFLLGAQASLLDVSAYTFINWLRSLGTAKQLYDDLPQSFPHVAKWLQHSTRFFEDLQKRQGKMKTISGEDAARKLYDPPEISDEKLVVDDKDPLVINSWLKRGDQVSVTPTDLGKVPSTGELVQLNAEVVSVRVHGQENKSIVVTFPRLGFNVQRYKDSKL